MSFCKASSIEVLESVLHKYFYLLLLRQINNLLAINPVRFKKITEIKTRNFIRIIACCTKRQDFIRQIDDVVHIWEDESCYPRFGRQVFFKGFMTVDGKDTHMHDGKGFEAWVLR
jgi:hypothetical protein